MRARYFCGGCTDFPRRRADASGNARFFTRLIRRAYFGAFMVRPKKQAFNLAADSTTGVVANNLPQHAQIAVHAL